MVKDYNKTAMITGASFGIGEALARVFADHQYNLVIVARSAGKLGELAAALEDEFGVRVDAYQQDLSQQGSAEDLFNAIQDDNLVIDVLVNNAGVLENGVFSEISAKDHQGMIQLNIAGLTDLISWFLPPMQARGWGRILNVASIAAFQPLAGMATYAATKAYVLSLSEALAEELRDSGVTVTAVCPGMTETRLLTDARQQLNSPGGLPQMLIGDIDDVARDAYHGCIKGSSIVVPGTLNLAATLASRATPKWLIRRLSGLIGRSMF